VYLITEFGNVGGIYICLQIDAWFGGLLMSLDLYLYCCVATLVLLVLGWPETFPG
jgi:hypothetical protein